MIRLSIPVVDLSSGRVSDRSRDTLTFDVPRDFDRSQGVASVDSHSNARYLAVDGSTLRNTAPPRPLSWRARGEECLVARARGTAAETAYRLCAVDPFPP